MDSPSRKTNSDTNNPPLPKRSSILTTRTSSLRRPSAVDTNHINHSRKLSLPQSHLDDWSHGFTGLVDLDRQMRELSMAERSKSYCVQDDSDDERDDNPDTLFDRLAVKNRGKSIPNPLRSPPRIKPAGKLQHHLHSLINSNPPKQTAFPDTLSDKRRSMTILNPVGKQPVLLSSVPHVEQIGIDGSLVESQVSRERSSSAVPLDAGSPILSSTATQSFSSGNSISTTPSSQVASDLGHGIKNLREKSPQMLQTPFLSKRKASSGTSLTEDSNGYEPLEPLKLNTIPSSPSPFGHYQLIQGERPSLCDWSFAQPGKPTLLNFDEERTDPLTPTFRKQPRSLRFDESLLTPNSAAAATWTDPEAPGYLPAGFGKLSKDDAKRNRKKGSRRLEEISGSNAPDDILQGSDGESSRQKTGSVRSYSTRDTLRHSAQSLAIGMRLRMLRAKRKLRPDTLQA